MFIQSLFPPEVYNLAWEQDRKMSHQETASDLSSHTKQLQGCPGSPN